MEHECILGVKSCMCRRHKPKPLRYLTELILDCWQREYDKRPYRNLILNGNVYRHKMFREMTQHDYHVLFEFLKTRTQIRFLEISYMSLPDKQFLAEKLAKRFYRLEKVCLIGIDIPIKLLETLAQLAEESKIRMLRLTGNALTAGHLNHLRCFLIHSTSIWYLDVGDCDIDEMTYAILADGIDKSKSLKAVDLSRIVNRSRVSHVDENKVGLVMAILVWRSPLVEIHLKKCGLDSAAIQPLLEYIPNNKALLYLDLGSNKIEGVGALELLIAIKKQNRLIGLDISNNRLGEYGGEVVAHHLPETKLKYLDIGRNRIPAECINFILLTIKKSFQMRILNIVGNEYDSRAGRTLSRQLTRVLFLEAVDVSVTYDMDKTEFRVVPCENLMAQYSGRYYRTGNVHAYPKPFFVVADDVMDLTWNQKSEDQKILVNGLFVGPFVITNDERLVFGV